MAANRKSHPTQLSVSGAALTSSGCSEARGQTVAGRAVQALRNAAPSLTFQGFHQLARALTVSEISGESTVYSGHVRGKQAAPPWLLDLTEHQQNRHYSIPLATSPTTKKSSPSRREQASDEEHTRGAGSCAHNTAMWNLKPPSQGLADTPETPQSSKDSSGQSRERSQSHLLRQSASRDVLADNRENRPSAQGGWQPECGATLGRPRVVPSTLIKAGARTPHSGAPSFSNHPISFAHKPPWKGNGQTGSSTVRSWTKASPPPQFHYSTELLGQMHRDC